MQIIYDAHNWLRRRFETGASMRLVIADVWATPGIVVFDGPYAKKRRKAVFPDYKKRRNVAADTMYQQIDQFEKLVKHLPVVSMRIPGWEADDVIATCIKNELKMFPDATFYVESTDVDFLQLPNTKINRGKFDAIKIPPDEMRLYKTLVGDTSDNIPGIKGFGKGAWATLTKADKLAFEEYFKNSDICSLPLEAPAYKKIAGWFYDNQVLMKTFWDIVGFYDVPMDEIMAHTTIGVENPDAIEEELRKFHL